MEAADHDAKAAAFGVQEQMGELGALLRAKEAELSRLHSQLAASPDGASDLPLAALDGTGEVTAAVNPFSHLKACGQANWSALACASTCGRSCQVVEFVSGCKCREDSNTFT